MSALSLLVTAFIIGILGNVHCINMCGCIAGSLGLAGANQCQRRSMLNVLLCNFARISTYMILGAGFGALGYFTKLQLPQIFSQLIHIFAAIFMIALGLYLLRTWMGLQYIERIGAKLWARIAPLTKGLLPITKPSKAIYLGLIWGLLPCGLVYSTLIWSISSQSIVIGAAMMLCFGLGTLPGPVLSGLLGARAQAWTKAKLLSKLSGLIILLFGIKSLAQAFT